MLHIILRGAPDRIRRPVFDSLGYTWLCSAGFATGLKPGSGVCLALLRCSNLSSYLIVKVLHETRLAGLVELRAAHFLWWHAMPDSIDGLDNLFHTTVKRGSAQQRLHQIGLEHADPRTHLD